MMLSDVCLSDVCLTYDVCLSRTSGLNREQIGLEKPKLAEGAHSPHVTETPFKRSKAEASRLLCSPPCWRVRRLQLWSWERVGRGKLLLRCRLLDSTRRFGANGEERGGGISWQPPANSLLLLLFAHQHKAAGLKTKQNVKQRLQRLLIRCSLC